MEWKILDNGDWQAKGTVGNFLLWKKGKRWTGRYAANKGSHFFKLPFGSLKDLKDICENNYYWEAKSSDGK